MDIRCLSVELVETIQSLVRKNQSVAGIVGALETVTLPGLFEYCCLQFHLREAIPQLPERISQAPLGRALLEILPALGPPSEGPSKHAVRNLSVRPVECCTISTTMQLHESLEWEGFCHRFELAARDANFTKVAAINLHSALFEMAENVVIHSRSPLPALVGYAVTEGMAIFTVADVGMGVLQSLRAAPKYSHLTEAVDAIQLALQSGVTSRIDEQGGFGFNSVFKALAEQWGQLRFRSGNGCITMDGTHLEADKSRRHFPPPLPGFQVTVCCRADPPPPSLTPF